MFRPRSHNRLAARPSFFPHGWLVGLGAPTNGLRPQHWNHQDEVQGHLSKSKKNTTQKLTKIGTWIHSSKETTYKSFQLLLMALKPCQSSSSPPPRRRRFRRCSTGCRSAGGARCRCWWDWCSNTCRSYRWCRRWCRRRHRCWYRWCCRWWHRSVHRWCTCLW